MEVLSVTESVVQHLRDRIIMNELKSGQKLSETELATELSISRAPLREAFCVLENEHLLVRLPRKGTYVSEISVEMLREVYSARKMIESHVIDVLKLEKIRNLPGVYTSISQVTELVLPKRDDRGAIKNYLKSLTDFHVRLVASTRNPWIISFYNSIVTSLARFQYFCIWIPGLTNNSQEQHEQIYDLLIAGSYEKAKKLLIFHIDYTAELIEDFIRQEGNLKTADASVERGGIHSLSK
jgi:DNA-binding GntR family transcriptional regulator